MHALRISVVGAVSITVVAAVLLALPLVAAGQVPGVDQVVGGVTQTAESIAPVPIAPALPAQAPAPQQPAEAPGPAPAAAPAAGVPAASAPRRSAPAAPPQASSSSGRASARSASKSGSTTGGDGAVSARGASDAPARASQDDSAAESAGSDVASQAGELSEDASPETLPFTGLRLALIVMAGLTALAAGVVLRRSAGIARR